MKYKKDIIIDMIEEKLKEERNVSEMNNEDFDDIYIPQHKIYHLRKLFSTPARDHEARNEEKE